MKFKIGDKIRALDNNHTETHSRYSWTGVVTEVSENTFTAKTLSSTSGNYPAEREWGQLSYDGFELMKKGKVVPENHDRFMAYGTGCNNKSELVKTEKELKDMLKKYAHDSGWSGELIGYKLVALYTAEKTVKLKPIKTPKTKKKK